MSNKENNTKEQFKQVLISTARVISDDYKINGKSCKRKGDDWEEPVKKGHDMDVGLCFQYYNPEILNYIASRIK